MEIEIQSLAIPTRTENRYTVAISWWLVETSEALNNSCNELENT